MEISSTKLSVGETLFTREMIEVRFELESSCIVCVSGSKSGQVVSGCIHYKNNAESIKDKLMALFKKLKQDNFAPTNLSAKIISNNSSVYCSIESFFNRYSIAVKGKVVTDNRIEARYLTHTTDLSIKKLIESSAAVPEKKKDSKIDVLIVDDSASMRKVIKAMLQDDDRISVVGEAADAFKAEKLMKQQMPDVITLDINMPGMDGVTFLKQYMKDTPVPTIMVTSFNMKDSDHILDALEHGAFDYIEKPTLDEMMSHAKELKDKVHAAYRARKKVRIKKKGTLGKGVASMARNKLDDSLIAIGASTGGIEALREVLSRLPDEIPPILIVQHIPPVFSKAFANRMNEMCKFHVKEAEDGDLVAPGKVLIAPGGRHMKLISSGGKLKVRLTDDPPVNRFRPSVDYMFNSVVEAKVEKNIVAALLTGMGNDGAKGILALKNYGGYSIVQDEESSVVFGMPQAAIKLEAYDKIVSLLDIAGAITSRINQ